MVTKILSDLKKCENRWIYMEVRRHYHVFKGGNANPFKYGKAPLNATFGY